MDGVAWHVVCWQWPVCWAVPSFWRGGSLSVRRPVRVSVLYSCRDNSVVKCNVTLSWLTLEHSLADRTATARAVRVAVGSWRPGEAESPQEELPSCTMVCGSSRAVASPVES